MDVRTFVDSIQSQLASAAEAGGDEARIVAERLMSPLESALRLAMQDALAMAAEEITTDLAPGSVELRVRGRDLEFVVTPPQAMAAMAVPPGAADGEVSGRASVAPRGATDGLGPTMSPLDDDDGGMSRINLRMPDRLKARVEQAANREGVSVNSWLVRAAASGLERGAGPGGSDRVASRSKQHFTGWAR